MVKTIAVAAGVVVVSTVAVLGVLRSRRTCHPIERSAVVIAPLGAVQSRIANLQQWTTWSPWERRDAEFDRKFDGPASGAGATYSWAGDEAFGAGRLTVVSAASGKVRVLSEIDRPVRAVTDFEFDFVAGETGTQVASSSDVEFTLAPEGSGTRVTWTIAGDKDASGKAFGLYAVPLQKFGDDMDDCLARLKTLIETDRRIAAH